MNKINMMIIAGLEDNALDRHVSPLLKIGYIKRIFIIRSKAGRKDQKITYISTHGKVPFLAVISKFLKALRCARENRMKKTTDPQNMNHLEC
jgi:hypothetical protein